MDAVHVGPFAFSIGVALVIASVLLANGVAAWFSKARGIDPGPLLWKVLLVGFAVARLVFVLRHHDLYLGDPVAILNVRDGGFDALAGFLAALAVGAELTRRASHLRRPLLASILAGCVLFMGGTWANGALAPAGAPLPNLEVRRLDGSTVQLRSFGGRPVVINLWATWCPPCRREMPALVAAQAAHPQLAFVFVNAGESAQTVERYLAAHRLRMSNLVLDPARQVAASTGASGYPTTLFYDGAGRLHARHMGELSAATLREKITDLLAAR